MFEKLCSERSMDPEVDTDLMHIQEGNNKVHKTSGSYG
jgi:hypothetical protein